MNAVAVPQSDASTVSPRADRALPSWLTRERVAVAAILTVSAALNLVDLNKEGFGNTYYAAAVWGMLQNWHAFLFASFDAGGFISVDKPPVGLWIQVVSVRLLGFSGLALLLPQALAGVATVGLVYMLVRRAFGLLAGCVSALALAVAPINVVTSRNNTMDAVLVLVLVLAAWAVTVAAERGSLRALLLGAGLVGLGFNIKMLQAYPVLPGFALAYLACAPLRVRSRVRHLLIALLVLVAVSLSWSVMVDLTPAALRPFVGSSGSNSELSLALGYNGLSRITLAIARLVPALSVLGENLNLAIAPTMSPGIGNPGLTRLFTPSLAGQASWLLPLALLGLAVAAWKPARRQRAALAVWGGWLLVWGAIFSFGRFYHVYYLIMLGPAVAVLSGVGVARMWRLYRAPNAGWERILLPAALLGSLWFELTIAGAAPSVRAWLTPVLVVGGLAGAATLVGVGECAWAGRRIAVAGLTTATAALLVAPLVWSAISVQNGAGGAWLPQAGPPVAGMFGGPSGIGGGLGGMGGGQRGTLAGAGGAGGSSLPGGSPSAGAGAGAGGPGGGFGGGFGGGAQAMTFSGANWDRLDPSLTSYLEANQGSAEYLVATQSSTYAAPFILASGQPALALGGYQNWDHVLSPDQLAAMVQRGQVHFFYFPSGATRGGGSRSATLDSTSDLVTWVQTSCSIVSGPWASSSGGMQLYDCASTGTSAG